MAKKTLPTTDVVTFELDGEEVTLTPSLRACITISNLHQSMYTTVERIMGADFNTICAVLAAGLNVANNKLVHEKAYRAGINQLRPQLIRYINIVFNGGKLPDDIDGPESAEDEEENPPTPSQ